MAQIVGVKRAGDSFGSEIGGKRTKSSEGQLEIVLGAGDLVAPGVEKQKLLEPLRGMIEIGQSTESISQV